MVWWERSDHLKNAYAYNQAWLVYLARNPVATIDDVINYGRELMRKYGFEVRFQAIFQPVLCIELLVC
jgi:hypothetical protein